MGRSKVPRAFLGLEPSMVELIEPKGIELGGGILIDRWFGCMCFGYGVKSCVWFKIICVNFP